VKSLLVLQLRQLAEVSMRSRAQLEEKKRREEVRGLTEKGPTLTVASPLTGPLFELIGSSSGRRAGRSGIMPLSGGADIVKLFRSPRLVPFVDSLKSNSSKLYSQLLFSNSSAARRKRVCDLLVVEILFQ
jgi:hypothetical protein